ncbi:MAG: MerR family transcriptional regulator [Rhodospirillales bacterium]
MTILDQEMSAERSASGRTVGKSATAFRTIAEVAFDLQLPAHVLRFWESKFAQIKPLKRRGGRRYYRPEDVDLLRQIRTLLYTDGYTIRGVQKLLKEGAVRSGQVPVEQAETSSGNHDEPEFDPVDAPDADEPCAEDALADVLDELEALRGLLRTHGF